MAVVALKVRVAWWARVLLPLLARVPNIAPTYWPDWACRAFCRVFFAALRRGVRVEA